MFEENGQIIKIDGSGQFLDIREAFSIGKVLFQFRKYDDTKANGSKITVAADIYLSIDDFAYFCNIMKDRKIVTLCRENTKNQREGYSVLRGNPKKQPVISRRLKVELGQKMPLVITGANGPGVVTRTGGVAPDSNRIKESKYVTIGLTYEQCDNIAIAGERAIRMYDMWVAMGTLEKNLERISFKRDEQVYSYTSEPNIVKDEPEVEEMTFL